jgi:very-short-patch-repair endonuclease
VITDLRDGTCSVLEHAFLVRVERAHGLPVADRQVRASSRGTIFRDVLYEAYDTVVELDGHTHHSSLADRDRDLDRDLDAVIDGLVTVRLGWGQVVARACETAAKLGRLLRARGWTGAVARCPGCALGSEDGTAARGPVGGLGRADSADSQSPGDCGSAPSSDDLPAA